MEIAFDNTYRRLPDRFFAEVRPASVPAPRMIRVNRPLAEELGIDPDWLESEKGLAVLAGNEIAEGSDPIAQAYAGHQFGGWVPQLGDGRAILLGEVVDTSGKRRDLQLKGSGRTPWSRGGDGKSPLGPVLREYIVSEAMHALGVPSTRALAAVETGEPVYRDEKLPGAVFTRVASSHVRVGTFQYFLAREDAEALALLADHVIDRHYPEAREAEEPLLGLLEGVVARQARLIASWMQLGFIHGVMNTDNMTISGETIDFGPCAFQDEFHSEKVFSSIDRYGRYAWMNQPSIGQWNLTRFAETLLPLLGDEREEVIARVEPIVAGFGPVLREAYYAGFAAKFGLRKADEQTEEWIDATMKTLEQHGVDFTRFFRSLVDAAEGDESALVAEFPSESAAREWVPGWKQIANGAPDAEGMARRNPVRIPRNHRVEEAIKAATGGDYGPFHRLVDSVAEPYRRDERYADLEEAPRPEERVHETFCGT